jgi:CHAT domain-containing protein
MLREVSLADPEYVSLQQVSIATLDAIRRALPDETTLIEYFSIRDEVAAFLISNADVKVVRHLSTATNVLDLKERLAFQFDKFFLGEDYLKAHEPQILQSARHHLQQLYRNLIAPLAPELKTPRIIVIPHGVLHLLPFHAFYDGSRYLMDGFEISYSPSASVLKYCLEKTDIHGEGSPCLIGVADSSTPFVSEEIEAVSRIYPNARILRDDQATREEFVRQAASGSFLHIAAHARFRQDNPMFSSFKLGDGWVTALDLFSMRCETNLVTLSGCESGMNDITEGDDLIGLMRGFLYAGARSLLLSLWTVNDRSTAALMTAFYREWQAGVRKSQALQVAMATVRQQYPNPFYWAPFMLVGKA